VSLSRTSERAYQRGIVASKRGGWRGEKRLRTNQNQHKSQPGKLVSQTKLKGMFFTAHQILLQSTVVEGDFSHADSSSLLGRHD
jgi:hypothetical protein